MSKYRPIRPIFFFYTPTERAKCDILKSTKEPLQGLTLQFPRP